MHKSIDRAFLRTLANDARKVLRDAGVKGSLLADPVSNPKVAKNAKVNVLTAPMHLAPGALSGYNVCAMATSGCIAACLHTAGNPAYMRGKARARIARTQAYFNHRPAFLATLVAEVSAVEKKAEKLGMKCGIRLNATSDIPWENISINIGGKQFANIMAIFPKIMFYDYTKRANRINVPRNYKLTFSLAENNDSAATTVLNRRGNVAIVFDIKRGRPMIPAYKFDDNMWPVLDGDLHDYRPIDRAGYIVGLRAKGKAVGDRSGFVRKAV